VPAGTLTGYLAGAALLTIEGTQAGVLRQVKGGTARGEVTTLKIGTSTIPKKHLAGLKYEDISFTAPLTAKPLTDWVAAFLKGSFLQKSGSIAGLPDASGALPVVREFQHAFLADVTFPALENSSREPGFLTVTLTPESTTLKSGAAGGHGSASRGWTQFRFEMAGLDGTKVARIESFTVHQQMTESELGAQRNSTREPSTVEFPNLKITMAEAGAGSWAAWLQDFTVNGNAGDDKEREGAIVLMAEGTELARVKLLNCGIVGLVSVEPAGQSVHAGQAISTGARRMTAELYCERMELATS
jgi:hypothetical protein